MDNVLLAVLVFLPVGLAYFLKSNAALGFLALCGGFAVTTLSGSDIEHLVGQTRITSLTSNDIDLLLLLVPLLVTLFVTYRKAGGKNMRYFNLVPAACAGGLLAIVAGPMFSDSLNTNITGLQTWQNLANIQSYIISVGFIFSLLQIWFAGSKLSKDHHKKHK